MSQNEIAHQYVNTAKAMLEKLPKEVRWCGIEITLFHVDTRGLTFLRKAYLYLRSMNVILSINFSCQMYSRNIGEEHKIFSL